MTKPIARDAIYRKRVFDADIIGLCVRWYITYRLSYRDLVEMMTERGIEVAHTTVLRICTEPSTSTARRSTSCIEPAHRSRKNQFSFGPGRRRL